MAAPNLLGLTTINGKTALLKLTDTAVNTVLSNAASSGKVLKVNSIIAANIDGTSPADITVNYNESAAGAGTNNALASTISVAADSTLVVLDKATSIYLEEDRSITAQCSAANDINIFIAYEDIS
jgi:hypothetical protein